MKVYLPAQRRTRVRMHADMKIPGPLAELVWHLRRQLRDS